MSGSGIFWFCMGALVASAAAFVVPSLWRSLATTPRWLRNTSISAFALAFTLASVWLYLRLGDPSSIRTSAAGSHAASAAQDARRTIASIDDARRSLALRLQRDGGSDADWELLAQSYEYSGNADAAVAARAHRIAADLAPSNAMNVAQSSDARSWLSAAQTARRERRLADAQAAFERVIGLQGMTADGWADYADVLGSISGSLRGAPANAIDKALAAEPTHRKALWLRASLAIEEKRYADALATWKRLRSVIADASPDARIIDANIGEAEALARTPAAKTTPPASVTIQGQIELAPELKTHASDRMTLFVYAKAVDQPGPPLAVLRTQVNGWPMRFKLDDSLAMIPGRELSAFARIIVEARLSASGDAFARSGDLQAMSRIVDTRNAPNLTLRLSKVIE